jgi:hypothetical protein
MAIVGKDYRGLRLCEACWNGVHWTKQKMRGDDGKFHRTAVNHCERGTCQCPCPQLPADRSGINLALRKKAEENRKMQQALPDAGPCYEHVHPEDRVRAEARKG